MALLYYPAIVERGGEGYGLYFPDLPGCVTAAETQHDLALAAEEALACHLAALAEAELPIPDASPIDATARDPEVDEVARLLVRAVSPGSKVRVNIMIDEQLLDAIDRRTENRSGFISKAIRALLDYPERGAGGKAVRAKKAVQKKVAAKKAARKKVAVKKLARRMA